jgi:excisionase family DNA binding protein
MTLTEAAASLGVTAATLRQQIAKGKLKARKVGRDWSVSKAAIEKYRSSSKRK